MRCMAKPAGRGNVVLEDAPIPERQTKLPDNLPLSPTVTWDQAPYWMLSASTVPWTDIAPFEPGTDIQRRPRHGAGFLPSRGAVK